MGFLFELISKVVFFPCLGTVLEDILERVLWFAHQVLATVVKDWEYVGLAKEVLL